MNSMEENRSEKLQQYLDGELNEQERNSISGQLATDISMLEEYNGLRSAKEAVRLYGLKQQVAQVHNMMMKEADVPVENKRPRSIVRITIGIAASLLIVVAAYWFLSSTKPTQDKVYASAYSPYTLVTARDTAAFSVIQTLYRQKKFNELDNASPITIKESLLCGIAALESGNYTRAEKLLQSVIQDKSNNHDLLIQDAEYYLALDYIKQSNYPAAISLFQRIQGDADHLHHSRVTEKLLRQLKKLADQ